MKPVLYYDEFSPPVRSCLMLIKELELDVELNPVELFQKEHLTPEYLKLNPLHTVPTLKDESLILTDSHAILIYLADKYGGETELYPKDEAVRAQIINKLFFEACVLFRRATDMIHEVFRTKNGENIDNHKERILEAYAFLETFLSADDGQHIAGSDMTIADFSVVTIVSTLDLLFPVTDEWPNLKQWFEKMTALPSYIEATEPGLEKIKNLLQSFENIDLESRRQAA